MGKTVSKRNQPEREIQTQILQWLQLNKIFCWRNKSVGIWYAKEQKFLQARGPGQIKGTSDILGIYNGRPLAIEVKSKTGVLSPEQAEFLIRFRAEGGIAMIARSLDDVIQQLGTEIHEGKLK